MYGKRKIPTLLILVFIMMFFILTTTSYAKNLENIDIETFNSEHVNNRNDKHSYLIVIGRSGIFVAQILPVVNLLLLILSKKTVDLTKRKNMIISNIALFLISGIINIIIEPQGGNVIMVSEEQANAIRKADIRRLVLAIIMLFITLVSQMSMLIYIIKQKIKTKNDKIIQDV